MMWVRWTLPRLRIDQVMTTCLKYCTPIAAVMFVGATSWKYLQLPSINNLLPMQRPGEVREFWLANQLGTRNSELGTEKPETTVPDVPRSGVPLGSRAPSSPEAQQ
jgi:NADH-quinone oxidoreductase subunit H